MRNKNSLLPHNTLLRYAPDYLNVLHKRIRTLEKRMDTIEAAASDDAHADGWLMRLIRSMGIKKGGPGRS